VLSKLDLDQSLVTYMNEWGMPPYAMNEILVNTWLKYQSYILLGVMSIVFQLRLCPIKLTFNSLKSLELSFR